MAENKHKIDISDNVLPDVYGMRKKSPAFNVQTEGPYSPDNIMDIIAAKRPIC